MSHPSAAADALGTAWTVFNLYPDPTEQPAFRRAVEHLQASTEGGLRLGVAGGGFEYGGRSLDIEREGAGRLAAQCFLHKVLTITVGPETSAEDVARLFAVLSQEESDVRRAGGVDTALRRDGVASITVAQRGALGDSTSGGRLRPEFVQAIVDAVAHPEAFAAEISAGASSADTAADTLFDGYRAALGALDDDDAEGRESVVQAYVEAFFHLESSTQDAALLQFLGSEELADRAFLDQFAGHELAAMAPRLDANGLSMLLDYARVATDRADERPAELISILSDTDAIMSARRLAASKIHDRLADMGPAGGSAEAAVASLRDEVPDAGTYFARSLESFRSLLALEARPDRFERILRAWARTVSDEVAVGRFDRAEAWLAAVTEKPPYDLTMEGVVAEAVADAATSEVISATIESPDASAQSFLVRLARSAMIPVIDALAEERDASRRRVLLDALSNVARQNPSAIVSRLGDDRWFVVRNLVSALRGVDQPDVVAAMRRLLDHEEPRVRVEVLKAVARRGDNPVQPLRSALNDEDRRVRETAMSLLGESDEPAAQNALIAAVGERARPVAERLRAIAVLGMRSTPSAAEFLSKLAGRKFAISSVSRQLRAAARNALGSSRV